MNYVGRQSFQTLNFFSIWISILCSFTLSPSYNSGGQQILSHWPSDSFIKNSNKESDIKKKIKNLLNDTSNSYKIDTYFVNNVQIYLTQHFLYFYQILFTSSHLKPNSYCRIYQADTFSVNFSSEKPPSSLSNIKSWSHHPLLCSNPTLLRSDC